MFNKFCILVSVNIERPNFENIPLKVGLDWKAGEGWIFEEKMDGVWCVQKINEALIAGEQIKDGRFFAFDILSLGNKNLRTLPLRERLAELDEFSEWHEDANREKFHRPARGSGGEFLEAVLSNGGEGIVAKFLDAPYGDTWFKCKRLETFDLIVTEKTIGTMSIRVATLQGEDRGKCACFSEYDNVRVGDIVEISAYSITKNGKLREPRFVKIRHDKMAKI